MSALAAIAISDFIAGQAPPEWSLCTNDLGPHHSASSGCWSLPQMAGPGPISASLAVRTSEIVREIELTNRGPYRFLKKCEHISLRQVWMACHPMSQLPTAADNHKLRWDIMLRWFEVSACVHI